MDNRSAAVPTLNPCEWCGGKAEHMVSEGYPHLAQRYVQCSECDKDTVRYTTGRLAAEAWNMAGK